MSNTNPTQRVVIGVFILIIGLLALLEKFNVFGPLNIFHFWPLVFILMGVLKILHSRARSSIFIGGGLILVGALLLLKQMGVIAFHLRDWWPVILIAVGGYIIFNGRAFTALNNDKGDGVLAHDDNSMLDISVIMAGSKTVNNSQDFKGGEITAIMGGVELDLRGASIQADAVLNLWATWGGIVIKVPVDWTVVNRCAAIMGGIEDKTIPGSASTKRLIITGTAIMGGAEIKN